MKEAASLIERAKKYLISSKMLIGIEDYESSVSRSYYAMFYSAQAVLLTMEMSFSSHIRSSFCFWKTLCKNRYISQKYG